MFDNLSEEVLYKILDRVYPVGSEYTNHSDGRDPSIVLGFGTWTAIAGAVTVGIDATQTEFDTLGETGGSKTHTLTIAQMPAHTHTMEARLTLSTAAGATMRVLGSAASSNQDTLSTGGGGAHNNLQPYVVAAVWKRVA